MERETSHYVRLTAPEIANIWTQYQNDTMAICVYTYMLEIVQDDSIRPILEYALSLANGHIPVIKEYFTAEKFPIPHGFTEDDVNSQAPRLFSDEFCLSYTYIMSVHGLAGYAAALTTNMRRDIRDYYVQCQNETMELFNRSLDLLLEKGIVSRAPIINPPNDYEFVATNSFMHGLFGGQRTLNCIEISNIFWDLKKAQLDKSLCIAFAQVAQLQELKDFIWRGVKIAGKHVEILETLLSQDHLPSPKSEDAEITNSTISPFSDRLLMYHIVIIGSTQAGLYGTAIATCQRYDLGAHFIRLMMELAEFLKDGFKLMIKHKWAEQMPLADDREKLSGQR
ncbi:DUF3231 family protein [Neobacillus niacini]|uniref:DUF3231 family protein n=1 Tax=Neobacillus niacini TaxID=86668 RepID=UPI0021CAEEA6|nr:DUF3231 family protein [Neobacillus niacini]MCM3765545.1 DUF3231 family protein [Neobacillus niacini]